MIEAARSGQRVVRLKGGDPFIFGRGGEEVEALRRAGIACSIIPGISAGIGAAAQFEVPLTFRREALRITFLTAHKAADAETVDWSTLTDVKMTVVVYMGMTAARAVRAGLLAAGRSPQTPVGVFARATRPDAAAVVGTLEQLPDSGRNRSVADRPSSSSATSWRIPLRGATPISLQLVSQILVAAE